MSVELKPACGWLVGPGLDPCPFGVAWDIYALNSYGRPGRVSSTCALHLAPRLGEYYDACDLSQRELWAWALPYDPAFEDDYEREDREEAACSKGPVAAQGEWQRTWDHANEP